MNCELVEVNLRYITSLSPQVLKENIHKISNYHCVCVYYHLLLISLSQFVIYMSHSTVQWPYFYFYEWKCVV